MRLLQVHTRYREPGGEDGVVAAERDLLQRAGHEVSVFEASNPHGHVRSAWSLARSPWNASAARAAVRTAVAAGVDVAHVHNTWHALSPAVVRSLHETGIPVVMTLHNYRLTCSNALLLREGAPCEQCVGTHPWHAVRYGCYRGSRLESVPAAATIALHRRLNTWSTCVDRFIVMTTFQKSRVVASGLPAERVDVLPHFVADPGPRPRPPSASRTLLYVGRLAPEKGVASLIDAFRAAAVDLELLVIGDGEERGPLEQRAAGVPGVQFLGRLPPDAVRQRLLAARALIFPSLWYETFGLALVEAMAAGTPVVASSLGGRRELVGPAAGSVFPAGDHDSLAAAITGLGDDVRVDAMGAAGRRRWQDQFAPSAALLRLQDVYEGARVDSAASVDPPEQQPT